LPTRCGIAFVASGALLALLVLPRAPSTVAFVGGLLAVAAIGWWDDHRPLSARLRLLVHLLASGSLVLALRGWPMDAWSALQALLALLWLAAMINFWNFMDGINGLASLQAVLAAGLYAGLAQAAGMPGEAVFMLGLAAAVMGFLPYNLPRARMFMGDVGSGALGFALGAFALMLEPRFIDPWILLLPVAPMLTDASLTLLQRMWLGRRWYAAHRSHLYQWWVRRGASHVRVSLAYALFSLVVVLPSMMLALKQPGLRFAMVVGVYALATALWLWGRAHLLRRVH
jgi:UDP-N-acetylmuramyl pentapeptide phosphotransferase/UDP-N-acetylglucosamine-1-phosphate transferase